MSSYQQHPSSFRDPSGFIFEASGRLYRQINKVYAEHYEHLMGSGLYNSLVNQHLLIDHAETPHPLSNSGEYYKTIAPAFIPFISYPYEWSFEQLKDAGLLTLSVMKACLNHGMILKDATPYNIQFTKGRPIHIDTLSFEKYDETKPWIAYRQFCETFLYPLLLSHYTGMPIHKLLAAYPEGIDAQVAAGLLPPRAKWNIGNWLHVFLPAKVKTQKQQSQISFSKSKLLRIVDDLEGRVKWVKPNYHSRQKWNEYYEESILNKEYLQHKQQVIDSMLDKTQGSSACDLGCNRGVFSKILAKKFQLVIAVDDDESSIATLYQDVKESGQSILPLCIDLANPSGNGGFNNEERDSFSERLNADLVVALALVHHLAIQKNIPLQTIASFLACARRYLIVEFVPPSDEKVVQLATNKQLVLMRYREDLFLEALRVHFKLIDETIVQASERKIFLFEKK